jgi:hypothetical protein
MSLRETAATGIVESNNLSKLVDQMIVFDLTKGRAFEKDMPGFDGAPAQKRIVCPVIVVKPDGEFDVIDEFPIFSSSIGRTAKALFDKVHKREAKSPYLVGILDTEEVDLKGQDEPGTKYVLHTPSDAEWDLIEPAVERYESAF